MRSVLVCSKNRVLFRCFCLSLIYDYLSKMTMALPLSAGLMTVSLLFLKDLIAVYSSFVRLFSVGSVFLPMSQF